MKGFTRALLEPREEAGLKITLISFLVALLGATVHFFWLPNIGFWVIVLATAVAFIGIGWHFAVNFLGF